MKKMKMVLMTAILGVASLSMVFTSCNTDECKDVVCENNGVCSELDGSCDCPAGYYGLNCENEANRAFVGTWSATEKANGATTWSTPYNVIVTADGTDVTTMYFQDYGNYNCTTGSYNVTATTSDGANYSISTTACSTNFNGTGLLSNSGATSTISGTYVATYGTPTTTDNVTIEMTK